MLPRWGLFKRPVRARGSLNDIKNISRKQNGIAYFTAYMRPNAEIERRELYECFDCNRRTVAANTLVCERCGGPLWNLGHSRDL